jgi:hypothetical protein
MRITKVGTDYISLNEDNFADTRFQNIQRVHLIKLNFQEPTRILIDRVLNLFPKTNRFVIEDNIRDYNSILKRTSKKYYVMNKIGADIISFFRKNNKILLNFNNLSFEEQTFFLMDGVFEDVLKNTEVIAVTKDIHDMKMEVLDKWKGNVIISEDGI